LPLREILLGGDFRHSWTEVFLFLADRCEHVKRQIRPALAEGTSVLCERYQDSTLAYQVYGRGLPEEPLASIFRAADLPLPDLTILLDLPSAVAWERVRSRGEPDRIEREGIDFRERVRRGYLSLAGRFPERFRVLDATVRPEELLARAEALLSRFLP
jgi:dTMP kinase